MNAMIPLTGGTVWYELPAESRLDPMDGNILTYGCLREALAAELDCSPEDIEACRELGGQCTACLSRGGLVLIIQVLPDERLASVESYRGVTRENFEQADVRTLR